MAAPAPVGQGDTMSMLFAKLSVLIQEADDTLREKIKGMEITESPAGESGSGTTGNVTQEINPVDLLNVQLNMNMYKTTTDLATNTMSTAQTILSAVNQNLNIR
ncbi:MAG: hypothetical protein V4629_11565 [Pseudomonadota bacterium]